jgi:hypothetical protein
MRATQKSTGDRRRSDSRTLKSQSFSHAAAYVLRPFAAAQVRNLHWREVLVQRFARPPTQSVQNR